MATRFYTEVLPSFFRRTPQEIHQKESENRYRLRKEEKHKGERNDARREAARKRAEMEPYRVMAGDLTSAFAGT
jgi:hypothetical protein